MLLAGSAVYGHAWPESAFSQSVAADFGQSAASDQGTGQPSTDGLATNTFGRPAPTISIDAIQAGDGSDSAEVVSNGTAPTPMEAAFGCSPAWNLQYESIVLWRNNNSQNSALIDPESLEFPGAAGPKLVGRMQINQTDAWEALWYAVGADIEQFYYNRSRTGFAVTNYYFSLSNGEINYVQTWNRFSLLGGFRALRFSENYRELYTPNGTELTMHTDNDLYGGQIGARWRQEKQKWFWEATGKFGVFGNRANQSQIVRYDYHNGGSDAFPRGYDYTTSVVYDMNFSAGLRLSRVWSARVGYDFLWIERLALAPNQFAQFNQGKIHTDGSAMLNGLEAGLEANW